MALLQHAVAVTDSAAVLLSSPREVNRTGSRVAVFNGGAHPFAIGSSTVTSDASDTDGPLIAVGAWSATFDLGLGDELYAICPSGDLSTAQVIETGVS